MIVLPSDSWPVVPDLVWREPVVVAWWLHQHLPCNHMCLLGLRLAAAGVKMCSGVLDSLYLWDFGLFKFYVGIIDVVDFLSSTHTLP